MLLLLSYFFNAMVAPKILIIEDDITLSDQITKLLSEKGYNIEQHYDGEKGLLAALRDSFDLILLDRLLPSLDGLTLLNTLRNRKQTPVMMITASGAEQERIEGYQKGADDYLPKPFNLKEMLVRIEALLRRSTPDSEHYFNTGDITAGSLFLNRARQEVYFNEQHLELTPIQFKLLWFLVENKGEILSKPFLNQCVLERAFSRYDRSLDMHISRVRKKLIECGMAPERLTTVHGKGYRFQ